MARLNAQQAASFPQNGGKNIFLSLQNDGDFAVVRFAYNSTEELMGCDSVHNIKNNQTDKYITVDCLKTDFSNPDSVCPLCQAGIPMRKFFFLQMRNEETGEMQVWQRSEQFVRDKILGLLADYEKDGTPITSLPVKIVRNGAKGDPKTVYTVIPKQIDNMILDQFPEEIDVRKEGIVKEYDFNTLQTYVQTGQLPSNDNQNNNQAIRPRGNQNYNNFGQSGTVEEYNQPTQPATRSRRTMNNQGGY